MNHLNNENKKFSHSPAYLFIGLILVSSAALSARSETGSADPATSAPSPESQDSAGTVGELRGQYTFSLDEVKDDDGVVTIRVTVSDRPATVLRPASETAAFRRELEATLISLLWENQPQRENLPLPPPKELYASNGPILNIPSSFLPEPATLALLALGLACILIARYRRS
jgi:hypothetical protein